MEKLSNQNYDKVKEVKDFLVIYNKGIPVPNLTKVDNDNIVEQMQRYCDLLPETFFFITNEVLLQIDHAYNIYENLGFFEKDFTLEEYFSRWHPSFWKLQMNMYISIYESMPVILENDISPNRMQLVFQVYFRQKDGRYSQVKQTSVPFYYNQDKHVSGFLCFCEVLKKNIPEEKVNLYEFGGVQYHLKGRVDTGLEWQFHLIQSRYLKNLVISYFPEEMIRLLQLVYERRTVKEVSDALQISLSLIKKTLRKIHRSAEENLGISVESTKELVRILAQYGLFV